MGAFAYAAAKFVVNPKSKLCCHPNIKLFVIPNELRDL